MEMEIIADIAAIRLLINTYMIKRVKTPFKPINQEKFIDEVWAEFREKNFNYSTKSILFTWKNLLENYQFYKKNFTPEDAKKEWAYFELMDNCFDNSNVTTEKFNDPKWILFLIGSLSKHRVSVLNHGLTMGILQDAEDDFRGSDNFDITQKDIYRQWLILKKVYRKYLSYNSCKFSKNYLHYGALKDFFEKDTSVEYNTEQVINKTTESISQNELDTAIASITSVNNIAETKKRKADHNKGVIEQMSTSENVNIPSNKEAYSQLSPFTIVMHDILLQCFKGNKKKIKNLGGEVDDDTLNKVLEEFQKLGYNVTKTSICNEWNDLTYRYELIKNTDQPQNWPYYNDMHYIYTSENEEGEDVDNTDVINDIHRESNVKTLLEKSLGNVQKITYKDVETSERLLNIYECNNKEFLEIKDILIERNLLREETNYLLNLFAEKFTKRKQ